MYTKPIVFKIFSIVMFVLTCIGVVYGLITMIAATVAAASGSVVGTIVSWVIFIVSAVVAVFFGYVNFTCLFTFGRMVAHEQKNDGTPFSRGIAFSGKFYKGFGTVVFYIALIITIIDLVYVVLSASWGTLGVGVIVLPIVYIAIMVGMTLLVFVTYNTKYTTFGTLLNIKTTKEPAFMDLEALKDTNPNTLRAYCTFLFYLDMIGLLGSLVLMLFIDPVVCLWLFGIFLVCLLPFGITGCFFDNLAKMQEHYMIKYKLFNGSVSKKVAKEGAK